MRQAKNIYKSPPPSPTCTCPPEDLLSGAAAHRVTSAAERLSTFHGGPTADPFPPGQVVERGGSSGGTRGNSDDSDDTGNIRDIDDDIGGGEGPQVRDERRRRRRGCCRPRYADGAGPAPPPPPPPPLDPPAPALGCPATGDDDDDDGPAGPRPPSPRCLEEGLAGTIPPIARNEQQKSRCKGVLL